MPDHTVLFEKEIRHYLRWVRVLARLSKSRPGGLSRWYQGEVFCVYTRAGTPGSRLSGRNSLCLANIEVKDAYKGQGFFTALVERLSTEKNLPFDGLELETVMNQRLALWLRSRGFDTRYAMPGRGDIGASFGIELGAGSITPSSK